MGKKEYRSVLESETPEERMARMEKSQALEGVYPEELLLLPFGSAAKAIRGGIDAARMAMRPKIANEIVRPQGTGILVGRTPKNPEDVTHAYRQISKRELEDIKNSGYARPDPTPDAAKRTWSADKKWWSAGDESGIFGRNWNRGDAETVRTTIDKVPSNRAVRAKDLEILNKETGQFEPFAKGGRIKDKPKPGRGDGAVTKGFTKGRMR